MTPQVSIIIPCHNARAWIAETIESARSQHHVETEIIVVDDGSEDGSGEIARTAGGEQLQLIRQAQMGASRARNVGTSAARGAYLQYLDADDVLEPDTLAARLAILERTDADVAYCDWVRWEKQPDGVFAVSDRVSRELGDRPDVELFTDAWWPPGAVMYRRRIVERIGVWREDLPVIQDARFLLDAALRGGRFAHVPSVGLKYRVHGDTSLSRRDPRAFLEDCYTNTSQIELEWTRARTLDPAQRRGLVKAYTYLLRSFFTIDRGRFDEVLSHLRAIEPHFVPDGPPGLRAVSQVLGYRTAEHIAYWYRWVRGR